MEIRGQTPTEQGLILLGKVVNQYSVSHSFHSGRLKQKNNPTQFHEEQKKIHCILLHHILCSALIHVLQRHHCMHLVKPGGPWVPR